MQNLKIPPQLQIIMNGARQSWLTLLAAAAVLLAVLLVLLSIAMVQLPHWRAALSPASTYYYQTFQPKLNNYPQENWQTNLVFRTVTGKEILKKAPPQKPAATVYTRPANFKIPTGTPKWVRNATPVNIPKGVPTIAIVIDDVGVAVDLSQHIIEQLPREVTLAFLPYGKGTRNQAELARIKGHEILIHHPMQPSPRRRANGTLSQGPNPGPNALYRKDTPADVQQKVLKNLEFLGGIAVGVNNHMGSHVTSSPQHMQQLFDILAEHKLFFLDSVTTPKPASRALTANAPIPIIERDIFLDHFIDEEKIMYYLQKTEEKARKQGYAIAIGHPHPSTRRALLKWIPTLKAKGIALVPITHILEQKGLK